MGLIGRKSSGLCEGHVKEQRRGALVPQSEAGEAEQWGGAGGSQRA